MMLACPATTDGQVARLAAAFDDVAQELCKSP
jgi:hypothetical protein